MAREGEAGVGPLAAVGQVHILIAVEQLDNLLVGLLESLVIANYRGVLGHGLAQLAPQLEGILIALVLQQLGIDLGLPRKFSRMAAVAFGAGRPWRT